MCTVPYGCLLVKIDLQVIDHYENPRNVGSLDKNDRSVGTGLVGAPACGDVMKLQVGVCTCVCVCVARVCVCVCVCVCTCMICLRDSSSE